MFDIRYYQLVTHYFDLETLTEGNMRVGLETSSSSADTLTFRSLLAVSYIL